jgi:hypothetical protein
MDASKILVLILVLVTVLFLVWIEVKSRRNMREDSDSQPELPTSGQEEK